MAAWVGVDVGGQRKGFDVAVIDDRQVLALQGHLTCRQVVDIVNEHRPAVVAIDSPRSYAPDGQTARDCELRLARAICGIRWTPEGLDLFDALADRDADVIEVFPTASWTRWHGKRGARTRTAWSREGLAALGLENVPARTNQDQRDAIAAAMTARQHSLALTETMGEIVVPADRW